MSIPSTYKQAGKLHAIPLLLVFFAVVVSSTSVDPNDTWWHIRSGEYYLEHGTIPSTDVFSHTAAGQNLFTHEWLSQVILYGIYHWFGFVGIRVLNSIMAAVTMLLLWRFFCRATDRLLPILFGIVVIFPDFLGRMNTRPEIFTLPLFVWCLDFVMHRDRSKLPNWRTVLSMALVACLWANLHGMALLGLMFLLAYTAGEAVALAVRRAVSVPEWEAVRRRGIAGDMILIGAYGLAVLATPMGYHIYVHAYMGRQFLPGPLGIMEWLSPFQFLGGILHSFLTRDFPWINIVLGWQFLFIAIPLAFCFAIPFLAMRRQLPTPAEGLIVLLALYQGATVVRFRWLFFVLLFWIIRAIGNSLPAPALTRDGRRVPGSALILQPLLLLIMASGIFMMLTRGISFTRAIDKTNYPIGIANFLEDLGATGNLFNSYNWGGYLIFRLWPDYRVFIDGRTDLYALCSRNLMLDHVTIDNREAGYDELLDLYNVDILVAVGRPYFPGPEFNDEIEYERRERRRQMTGAAVQSLGRAPPPSGGASHTASDSASIGEWIPMLVNREGSVYLRNTASREPTLAKLKEFFSSRGVPFHPSTGPDMAAVIRSQPKLAVRYNILSDEVIRGIIKSVDDEASDEAIESRIQLAKAVIQQEMFRDGIEILHRVLEVDRYNNDALLLIAFAHHLVGENQEAYEYLERSATVGRNEEAVAMMRHCASHTLPRRESTQQLPPLEELVAEWKGYY